MSIATCNNPMSRLPTAQSFDGQYDFTSWDNSLLELPQWMDYTDVYDPSQCPPPTSKTQLVDNMWAYEGMESFNLPHSSNYHQTTLVTCSPRSDASGSSSISLSPQPTAIYEYSNAFNFDFPQPTLPAHFPCSPSPSSSWSSQTHIAAVPRRPNMSHSPSTSCSSLDMVETKPSRSTSPSKSHPSTTSDLDAHQLQRRRFPCVIIGCERRFTSQYTLKVHMEAHKPKPRSSFPCTLGCAERFSRQHDRLRHEVAKHGKICEFLCDDCGRFFSTQKTLGNHKCPVAQGGTRWVNN